MHINVLKCIAQLQKVNSDGGIGFGFLSEY